MSLSSFIADILTEGESSRLQAWLADPAQGFELLAPPDAGFYSLTDEDLRAAGLNLHSRRLLLAKLKSNSGGHNRAMVFVAFFPEST